MLVLTIATTHAALVGNRQAVHLKLQGS